MSAFVYAIRREVDGPIKIGFSSYPKDRLRTLHAVETLAMVECVDSLDARKVERALHSQLSQFALGREWFSPTEEVLATVASLGVVSKELPSSGALGRPSLHMAPLSTYILPRTYRKLKAEAARRRATVWSIVEQGVIMALDELEGQK